MNFERLGRRGLLLAACATSVFAAPAFAQQQAPTAQDDRPVEEVIVTATRRETALQNVAVAVTAIGTQAIESAGVKDIRDLTQLAPSLQVPVSENSGSVTARIRGVGTQGSNPGLESSVGVVIDGVFRARNSVAFGDLGEIRAIEVLRGPQGTLFGRNTSAGLINVTTKKPSFEFGTSGDATFGNYGLGGLGLGITGPLIEDKLAGRLYVTARARDGYMNVNNGTARTESNDSNYYAIRGQLLYTPSETFDARLIVDQASRAEACCAAAVWTKDVRVPSTTDILNKISPNALQTTRNLNSYLASANRTYDQDIEDKGISLEMNWDVGFGKLTSITAQRNWKRTAGADSDYSGADVVYSLKSEGAGASFDNFTQEFRYAGSLGKLDWLVGTIYSKETINSHVRFRTGNDYQAYIGGLLGPALALANPALAVNPLSPTVTNTQLAGVVSTWQTILGVTPANIGTLAPGGGQFDDYEQNAESIALFTHNIYQFNDDFSVTLGLRYTSEEKKFQASYRTQGNTACTALENRLGLDAARNAGALSAVVGAICAPWMRSALDGMDHRQEKSEKEWSGIVSAAYRIAPNINSYASYSRGYKAGGFNLDRAFSDLQNNLVTSIISPGVGNRTVRQPNTSFAPETVDAYEIGLKTQWFDRALTANFAAFHQTFENFQLNTFTGISFVVTSVPEVVSQGVEFDYVLRTPIEGLSITGGAAYSLTEYTKNLGSASQPNTFLGQNPNLYWLPGAQLTSSPVWTYGSAFNYERSVFSDKATFKAYTDFRTITDTITGSNLDPRKTQPGYTLINARLALSTADDRWTVELWGRNITDERYAQITFDSPLQGDAPALTNQPALGGFAPRPVTSQINAFVGEPRTYGVTLRWNY
ncbi:TonB-dependent receptor [Aquidulcibacter sp.]|uniref:TonB-dependent receptor n=1 Tax=Aquidulcibacter sp. TaxID=2052990 RepID=UPI0025C16413|nr:TonB-dependent receptor [Aquidulcibacter sp.]MCA3691846.1 TonB-dependent receptor [Aquidulcibacter sp.]